MNIEDRLTAELTGLADEVSSPRVEIAGLAAAGRRERTRRRSIAAGVASAVVAVVVGGALLALPALDRDADPVGPPGGPTSIPWFGDGVLHLGNRDVKISAEPYFANGTVLYVVIQRQEVRLYFERAGGPLLMGTVGGIGLNVQLSGNGQYAVFKEGDQNAAELVAWDLGRATEMGRIEVEPKAHVYSVDNTGRVYYSTERRTLRPARVWRPGSQPIRLRLPDGQDPGQGVIWPGGFSVGLGTGDETSTYGTVAADGRFTPVGEVPSAFGRWSPDGAAYAYERGGDAAAEEPDDQVAVDHLDGTTVELDLPRDPTIKLIEWESTDLLVVEVDAPDGKRWIRCDATSGQCAEVQDGPSEYPGHPNDYPFDD